MLQKSGRWEVSRVKKMKKFNPTTINVAEFKIAEVDSEIIKEEICKVKYINKKT